MTTSKFISAKDFKGNGKGFQMTFENGNTISVMFSEGNYCENRNTVRKENNNTVSSDAEIAIWNESNQWHKFKNGDTVNGYLSANEVVKWITFAATKKVKP